MKTIHNDNGITIRELKELVKELPETDHYGENYTVWLMTSPTTSSQVTTVIPLNQREGFGQDIVLEVRR